MTRNLKRAEAFGAAALTAVSLSVAGAGTAGAGAFHGRYTDQECYTQQPGKAYFELGTLRYSETIGNCSFLKTGDAYRGTSSPNVIVIANVTYPNGVNAVAYTEDPTGLYPTR